MPFSKSELIALLVTLVVVAVVAGLFTFFFGRYTKSTIEATASGENDIDLIDISIADANPKAKRRKKVRGILANVVFYVVLAITVPMLAVAIVNRANGGALTFGDTSVLLVGSGSMSFKNDANLFYLDDPELQKQYVLDNQFNTNDLVFLKNVNVQDDIKLYDVVSFFDSSKGITIIHRVINIDKSKASWVFTTRGDANNASDGTILFEDIRGKYTNNRIPGLGLGILFFQSPSGIATMLAVLFFLGMTGHFTKKLDIAARDRAVVLQGIIERDLPTEGPYENVIIYKGITYRFDEKGFKTRSGTETEGTTLTKVTVSKEGTTKQTYHLGTNHRSTENSETEDPSSSLRRHQ